MNNILKLMDSLDINCPICDEVVSGTEFNQHMNEKHPNRNVELKCPFCSAFIVNSKLNEHLNCVHKKKLDHIKSTKKKYKRFLSLKKNLGKPKAKNRLGFAQTELPTEGKPVQGGAPGLGKKR